MDDELSEPLAPPEPPQRRGRNPDAAFDRAAKLREFRQRQDPAAIAAAASAKPLITRRDLEAAVRRDALDILYTYLHPTIERILSHTWTKAADKCRALELLWEIGRDRTLEVRAQHLNTNVDLNALLQKDPKLLAYVQRHPDLAERFALPPSITERDKQRALLPEEPVELRAESPRKRRARRPAPA